MAMVTSLYVWNILTWDESSESIYFLSFLFSWCCFKPVHFLAGPIFNQTCQNASQDEGHLNLLNCQGPCIWFPRGCASHDNSWQLSTWLLNWLWICFLFFNSRCLTALAWQALGGKKKNKMTINQASLKMDLKGLCFSLENSRLC